MEEISSDNTNKTILSVLTGKKKAVAKKTVEKKAKDEEARAKVEELLKNTPVASLVGVQSKAVDIKNEFDQVREEHQQEKTQKWLENQVNELNHQVEDYENEILFYKEEINRLNEIINRTDVRVSQGEFIQSNNPVDTSMNHTIIALFKHFENVYERGFTDAKLAHPESGNGVLDMFMQFFPQLQSIRRYRYRGMY